MFLTEESSNSFPDTRLGRDATLPAREAVMSLLAKAAGGEFPGRSLGSHHGCKRLVGRVLRAHVGSPTG